MYVINANAAVVCSESCAVVLLCLDIVNFCQFKMAQTCRISNLVITLSKNSGTDYALGFHVKGCHVMVFCPDGSAH